MSKRKFRLPSLPAGVLLRPQLDALLGNPQADPEIVLAQALALSKNVSADVFLTTFLRSFAAAPTDMQANLTPHLSTWFLSTGLKDAATKLVTAQREDALVLNTA